MARQTASQTVGPFFHHVLIPEPYGRRGVSGNVLVTEETQGERVRIEGRLVDGTGAPVPAGLIELWQANAAGRYRHPADARGDAPLDPAFAGYGRAGTDDDGRFWFETVKPGAVPGPGGVPQAPHLNLVVFARNLDSHLFTRLYFSDEKAANEVDPVLASVPAERRNTLVAGRGETPAGIVYRHEIRLQSEGETVFFEA